MCVCLFAMLCVSCKIPSSFGKERKRATYFVLNYMTGVTGPSCKCGEREREESERQVLDTEMDLGQKVAATEAPPERGRPTLRPFANFPIYGGNKGTERERYEYRSLSLQAAKFRESLRFNLPLLPPRSRMRSSALPNWGAFGAKSRRIVCWLGTVASSTAGGRAINALSMAGKTDVVV